MRCPVAVTAPQPALSIVGIMKTLILALSLATVALSGCAQLQTADPGSGASAAEEQRPYPSRFKNDHYYQP